MMYCELQTAKDYAAKKMHEQFDKFHLNTKLDFPEIIWKDLGKNTAGYATPGKNIIYLNTSYLQSKSWKEFLDDTPLHELAHIVATKMFHSTGHDKAWRHVCYNFGLSGNRCHTFATPDNKANICKSIQTFKAYCNCGCEHEITQIRYRRMLNGVNYICCKCGSRLRLTK